MKRFFPVAGLVAGLCTSALYAQNAPPSMAADVKQNYNQLKMLLTQAAEKMPEDGYSFQPTKEEPTFGGRVAHVADAQMNTCSTIGGSRQNLNAGSKTAKADLVAALKESFDACDPVYNGLTDANAAEPVPTFRGEHPRLTTLFGNLSHDNECYGAMAVYLRLKGIVPPSTEMMNRMRGGGKKK